MQHQLLIVDNYDSYTYNLVQIVNEHGSWQSVVMKHDVINLGLVGDFEKIIFSPGAGVPDDYQIMRQIIKKYSKQKSILGICLGHQAIAEAFGGSIYNLKKVYHGIKQSISIINKADYLFKDIPSEIEVGLYHSWAVSEKLPNCLKATAISFDNIIMGLSHVEYDVKGLQFHPESYMSLYGKQILFNWLNRIED